MLNEVKSEQTAMNIEMQSHLDEIKSTRSLCENLQLDVDCLNETYDTKLQDLDGIKERLDYMERENLRNEARIFGLNDSQDETKQQLKHKVLKDVLNVACPNILFRHNDIKHVQRIEYFNHENNRMVLITFRYDDDKYEM